MPVKNGESDAEGDVSGAETERSNSSQAHDTSDEEEEEEEEANECDSDDSSEMDASEIERRRAEYLEDLASLERQFGQLREQYYYERISLIDRQLSEVRAGRSEEFLQPQKELDKVYRTRIEVADVLRKFRLQNIEHKYLSEEQAAAQHFESEKQMTMDYLREDLLERIRRLEEDRHNVEISWDNWGNDKRQSKVRGPGRKKAVTVTGPYVVYMLREEDIMEDWTIIRKALKRSSTTAATGGSGGSTAVATTAAGVASSGGGGGGSGSGGLLSVQLAATAMVGGG